MGFGYIYASMRLASTDVTEQDRKNFEALKQGGFSHNPLTGASPTDGFIVGLHTKNGGVGHAIPEDKVRPEHLAAHRAAAAHHWHDPDMYQGGWLQGGHAHLDTSRNIQDRDEAIREGQRNDQIAIWDVKNQQEIPVGGKGEA